MDRISPSELQNVTKYIQVYSRTDPGILTLMISLHTYRKKAYNIKMMFMLIALHVSIYDN